MKMIASLLLDSEMKQQLQSHESMLVTAILLELTKKEKCH